jgi:hypothetical protein
MFTAALLVKQDFVLITATKKTLLAQRLDWSGREAAARRNKASIVATPAQATYIACGGDGGTVAGWFLTSIYPPWVP